MSRLLPYAASVALVAGMSVRSVPAADQLQWGERFSRNMVSAETGLPATFDPETGANVKWKVSLGTSTYSTPVVADGRLFIGTNNERPRDPRVRGDRGVLLCLDERDGRFLWQFSTPRRGPTNYWDWPRIGICSSVTLEGDRAYVVANRGEAVCFDVRGMADGNGGPFDAEGALMARPGDPPLEPGKADADVLWLTDLTKEAGVRQHDGAHGVFVIHGDYLYVNTSNGLNDRHNAIGNPKAPSLVVLDKATGRIVAREREGISTRIFHSTWGSPSLGEVGGRPLVFFGGGDGVVYAFEPYPGGGAEAKEPAALKLVWRCDCDPDAPKENIHRYIRNRKVSPSNIKSVPVFHGDRIYVTYGGDVWWGKNEAWLKCIDATKAGDVTRSGVLWTYPLRQHCMSTPAVHDGLVYAADCGHTIHCVDAETGKAVWTHDAEGGMWASPMVADGKVYIGTRRGLLWILAAGRRKQVLASVRLDGPVNATVTAANGVLYIASMKTLYAVASSSN
jgi:outer membrane protein assembly factor BamB